MKPKKELLNFFEITRAAFDFARKINAITGKISEPSEMEMLHKTALDILQEDEFDELAMDDILAAMEFLAMKNAATKSFRMRQGQPPI